MLTCPLGGVAVSMSLITSHCCVNTTMCVLLMEAIQYMTCEGSLLASMESREIVHVQPYMLKKEGKKYMFLPLIVLHSERENNNLD